jgi:hypothetical protein
VDTVDVVSDVVSDDDDEEEEGEVVLMLDSVLLEGDDPVWPLSVSKPGR